MKIVQNELKIFFLTANSGAAAGGILFFLSYIPYLFLQQRYATLSWGAKIASSLVSNIAMSYGGQVIGMFEGTGKTPPNCPFTGMIGFSVRDAYIHIQVNVVHS